MILVNNKILFILISLVPVTLFTGPFLPGLFLSISSLYFLFFLDKYSFKKYFLNIFILIFFSWCVYIILLSLFSSNISLSLESSLFYFRFGIFSLAIWFALDTDSKFINYFLYSLIFSLSFVIFDAYFQLIFGYNVLNYQLDTERLSGIFDDEKILGSYLARLSPILLILSLYPNNNFKKITFLSITIFIASIILIYYSGERSAIGLLVITIFLLFIFVNISFFKKIIILLTIFFISLIFFLLSDHITNRIIDKTIEQIYDNDKLIWFSIQHEAHAKTALKITMDDNNYIFGIGPKMFREICKSYPTYHPDHGDTITGCSTHPHNTYLQLISETGIIGAVPIFLIFIMICFVFIKRLWNRAFDQNYLYDYKILLLIPIFVSIFPIIPTGSFFNSWISIIYFLPIGFFLYEHFRVN